MEKKSGIVVKVTENYIVLIMPDGSFKNVKRSKSQVPLIGERFIYEEKQHSVFSYRWTAVAAACMLILAVFTYRLLMMGYSQPAYIAALDINPSVEVYADKNLLTTNVTALNEDGRKLADMAKYKGKNLLDTIGLIVEQSISEGYLKQNQKGLIKITVIPMQENGSLNGDSLKTSIQELLLKDNIQAEIEVGFETRDIIEQARQSGLSINRYILYKSLRDKGFSITVEEARNMPLKNLRNYETTRNKDGNEHKKNQNGEMPDKGSIPETLKGSDAQKGKAGNDGETGMDNKMSAEKPEINSGLQRNQANNGMDDNSKKDGGQPPSSSGGTGPQSGQGFGPGSSNTGKKR